MAQVAPPPRLDMRGVRKAFGATVAVDGVDFAVAGGEVCALVGQNGAGKSTLMAILSGAIRPVPGPCCSKGRRGPRAARVWTAGVVMIQLQRRSPRT